MKSSTSQRAGSSRTFLKTMYFTSGAKVITSRLRTLEVAGSLVLAPERERVLGGDPLAGGCSTGTS